MMLASELALANVKVLVLEKRSEPVAQSRATTVHPRTLEAFLARDIIDRFIDRGKELLAKNPKFPLWHFANMFKLKFHKLDSSCNYTLWLPQSHTENLLEERAIELGANIQRNHELINIIEKEDGVIVEASSASGPYFLQSSYIVGCDGAGSLVRSLSNIDFPGTDTTLTAVLADVIATRPLSSNGKLSIGNSKGRVIGLPLDEHYTRFVLIHGDRTNINKLEEVKLEEVKEILQEICKDDFGIEKPKWLSRFGNANRLAAKYRKGRVLLAGDAAHMHLPAGGQGLNYGVQDAFNLGWKLAAEIKGWAPSWLLDSYHVERHSAGQKLMYDVERQTSILFNFTESGDALRNFFENQLLDIPAVNELLSQELAGFHIEYPSPNPEVHPLEGKRVPDLRLKLASGTIKNLYSLLYDGRFILILFGENKNTIEIHSNSRVRIVEAELVEDRTEYQNLRAILIRPDAHIAWVSSQFCTKDKVLSALEFWCGKIEYNTSK